MSTLVKYDKKANENTYFKTARSFPHHLRTAKSITLFVYQDKSLGAGLTAWKDDRYSCHLDFDSEASAMAYATANCPGRVIHVIRLGVQGVGEDVKV
jgi:hypothetical protein